ncbi:DUF4489 domain-containing protein [Clostridium nigeriense]|uniref:DUF4489 domain-containing protein n=1 Tax=Clostridium nigeriense TaxID=1805470 RepID=UPI000829B81C|nr:DUF4489 domain-containing protein [Clostridium nigeriense]
MNSCPISYYEYDKRDRKKEEKKYHTIIKCGCPSSALIPTGTAVGTTFTLESLNLDTSCLCNPIVRLDFVSNLILTGFTGALSIRVFKQCRGQFNQTPVGPAWTFSVTTGTTDARIFSFFVCDTDSCNKDCCNYSVVATVTTATAGTINVVNAELSAIATSKETCEDNCGRNL